MHFNPLTNEQWMKLYAFNEHANEELLSFLSKKGVADGIA